MAGLDGFGTKLYRMSGTNSTAIAGITKVGGPSMEGKDIDVTDMDSTNGFMEFLPGIVNGGEVDLEMNYIKTDFNTNIGLFRTTGSYKLVLPDSANLAFNGYMKKLGLEAPYDDKVGAKSSWKISGKPTFATN